MADGRQGSGRNALSDDLEVKVVELEDWDEFAGSLHKELKVIGHCRMVALRNFELSTMQIDPHTMEIIGEDVDRLELAIRTGTDRSLDSPMWNAEGHDYRHDLCPVGKSPNEIIYAYSASIEGGTYKVHLEGDELKWDLTEGLTSGDGILVYDRAKLQQAAKNEYWFKAAPLDALLLVFTIKPEGEPT
jgi:hypothetical protein